MSSAIEYPVIDGMIYNPKLLYAPCRSLPLIREAILPVSDHNFSPRFFLAPTDALVGVGAGLTVRTQMRMVPNSVIVGLKLTTLNGFAASDLMYLIEDANRQFSDGYGGLVDGQDRFLNCNNLVPTYKSGAAFCWLNNPYKVGGGVISVAITNLSTSTLAQCQLLLYVMEPVQVATTAQTGSLLLPQRTGN